MALINTTTTGILGTTVYGDGSGDLTVQKDGVTINKITAIPAFRAYQGSNQTVSNNTWTKLQMNTENFDTNNNYDTSNYRFTPSVAGYYQVTASMRNLSSAGISYAFIGIYKNGSSWQESNTPIYLSTYAVGGCTSLVYLNGSTDYIEAYAFIQSSGTNTVETNSAQSSFSAALVRAA